MCKSIEVDTKRRQGDRGQAFPSRFSRRQSPTFRRIARMVVTRRSGCYQPLDHQARRSRSNAASDQRGRIQADHERARIDRTRRDVGHRHRGHRVLLLAARGRRRHPGLYAGLDRRCADESRTPVQANSVRRPRDSRDGWWRGRPFLAQARRRRHEPPCLGHSAFPDHARRIPGIVGGSTRRVSDGRSLGRLHVPRSRDRLSAGAAANATPLVIRGSPDLRRGHRLRRVGQAGARPHPVLL